MVSGKPDITSQLLAHLDAVIKPARVLKTKYLSHPLDIDDTEAHELITSARAVIERIAGRNSVYYRHAEEIMASNQYVQHKMLYMLGVVESLRAGVEAGYINSITELIHGELFGDFLEMARYLLDEDYKDPSAVVAGAALEAHLRQLCVKNGIATVVSGSAGSHPKKADAMNAELAKVPAYSGLDQKSVTAWLGLRNKAAHGEFSEYSKGQVALMVTGIQDFITRNPA
jgi:RNA-binding protein YhbY